MNQIKTNNQITSNHINDGNYYNAKQRNPNLSSDSQYSFIYINHHIIHIITFAHIPSFFTSFPTSSFNLNNTQGSLSLSYPRHLSPLLFSFLFPPFPSSFSLLPFHPVLPTHSNTPPPASHKPSATNIPTASLSAAAVGANEEIFCSDDDDDSLLILLLRCCFLRWFLRWFLLHCFLLLLLAVVVDNSTLSAKVS